MQAREAHQRRLVEAEAKAAAHWQEIATGERNLAKRRRQEGEDEAACGHALRSRWAAAQANWHAGAAERSAKGAGAGAQCDAAAARWHAEVAAESAAEAAEQTARTR